MGEIVVGVDGSPPSLAALRFALAEARLRGARLVALHAWVLPLAEGLPGPFLIELPEPPEPPLEEARAALGAQAAGVVAGALSSLAGELEGVEVAVEVVEADPATALVERSRKAALLVLGSRGRGGFAGLLLGSVSRHCIHRARCPVVVVRSSPNA